MSGRGALRFGALVLLVCTFAARAQIVLHTVEVGEAPNALAIDSRDYKVFVSCEAVDSVYVLDATADSPEEFVLCRLPVGDYPVDVVFNPADTTIWVVNKQVDSITGSVTAIDAASDSVVATIEVGERPTKAVWASAGNKLYTLDHQTVTAIDCSARQKVGTIRIPDSAYSYTDLVYNPSMDRLYLVARLQQGGESYLHVVDCTIDRIIRIVGLADGAAKACHAPNVNRLFVACNSRTLNVIDCASDLVIAWLPIRDNPTSIIWSDPPVNRVWIACGLNGNAVHYMQADGLEIEGRIETPNRGPAALLYNPYTKKVFATSNSTHEIMVFNARIPGIIDTLRLDPYSYYPYDIALYPRMNRYFVANYTVGSGTVTVLVDFLGIEESMGKSLLLPARAVPNPASPGKPVTLQAPGFKPRQVTLLDAMGRTVYQGCLGRNGAVIAPEAPGVYFYTVTDGRMTSFGKFTVR